MFSFYFLSLPFFLLISPSLHTNINLNLQIILKRCCVYGYMNQLLEHTEILQSVLWEYTCHPATKTHNLCCSHDHISNLKHCFISLKENLGVLINVLHEITFWVLLHCCLPLRLCSRLIISTKLWSKNYHPLLSCFLSIYSLN